MQFFYYRWCGCGDSAMCFVIACIAIFNYCQIWQYSVGHILCTIEISLPKTWVLAHGSQDAYVFIGKTMGGTLPMLPRGDHRSMG